MYGLKQAALPAYKKLVNHLAPHGYRPVPHSLGLWTHDTRPIRFCLCVDDFGIKYFHKDDVNHLIDVLRSSFQVSCDWDGRHYCGLTIDWQYDDNYVDISVPGYIEKVLHKFQHSKPTKPQYAPHTWTAPVYGKSTQHAKGPDTPPLLDEAGKKYVQSVVGSMLYYSRAVDPTMLPALNEIATSQAHPYETTKQQCKILLDAKIRYYASDMILHLDSDAAYLVLPNALCRIAGHFYLSSTPPDPPALPQPQQNGPTLTECRSLKHVVASTVKAETGGLFQ